MSHCQPFASLISGTQVKKVPTQVEKPSYQSPANSAASNTGKLSVNILCSCVCAYMLVQHTWVVFMVLRL